MTTARKTAASPPEPSVTYGGGGSLTEGRPHSHPAGCSRGWGSAARSHTAGLVFPF